MTSNARTIAWSEVEVNDAVITRSTAWRNESRNYSIVALLRRISDVNRVALPVSKRDYDHM